MKISNPGSFPSAAGSVTASGEAGSSRHVQQPASRKKPAAAAGNTQDRYQQTPTPNAFEQLVRPSDLSRQAERKRAGPTRGESGDGEPEAMTLNSLTSKRSSAVQLASKTLSDTARSSGAIIGNIGK
ncbi:MAG: hypothetical protein HYX75_16530 [Acidobacteria bacterium]|nr:hypothetical protein [Acidobacteriota bacterium]